SKNVQAWTTKDLAKDDASPVTVADFAVQALVIDHLRTCFPNDKFVAEESSEVRSPGAVVGDKNPSAHPPRIILLDSLCGVILRHWLGYWKCLACFSHGVGRQTKCSTCSTKAGA